MLAPSARSLARSLLTGGAVVGSQVRQLGNEDTDASTAAAAPDFDPLGITHVNSALQGPTADRRAPHVGGWRRSGAVCCADAGI
jgi:hypothetical protein